MAIKRAGGSSGCGGQACPGLTTSNGQVDELLLTLTDFVIVLREIEYRTDESALTEREFHERVRRLPAGVGAWFEARGRGLQQPPIPSTHRILGTGGRTMPNRGNDYAVSPDLVIGTRINARVPEGDQLRQRGEIEAILHRLHTQPGVILADEVGMGKTYVALGVAYSVATSRNSLGPVIIMVPANLIDKWEQDLKAFCELYTSN